MAQPADSVRGQLARIDGWSNIVIAIMVVALAGLGIRVAQLKIAPDERLADAAGTSTSNRPEHHRRGSIVDRRGRLVATTTMGHRLFVDPQELRDPATIAVDLADLIGVDPIAVDRRIQPRLQTRYVAIDDVLQSWQVDAVRGAGLRGVGLEECPMRHYPAEHVARRLVGKVGTEGRGLTGLEHVFDTRLHPASGHMQYLRDARRRLMWVSRGAYEPGSHGDHVQLSIDLIIQEMAERRLHEAVEHHNAGGGRIIVLDCRSGEVLAMADVLRARPGWDEMTDDPMRSLDPALGRNRCITDPYEPGSTFKPFVWAAATELGLAHPDDVLPTPAHCCYRSSQGRSIRDAPYIEDATWEYVLVRSINSGMAMVAERMTERQLQDVVGRFGFGRLSGIGLPGESIGIVTPPSRWNHYTQTSVAMGHEIAVTPVQMVRGFSVFATGGLLPRPRLTAAGTGDAEYQFVNRVLPAHIADRVRQAMREVVISGTGRRARSSQYRLFGKSGTAQLPKKDGGGYHEDRYVSSFIAGAPLETPRLVVLCVIDDRDKKVDGHYGGKVAGPVVRDVMDEALMYLGVMRDETQ